MMGMNDMVDRCMDAMGSMMGNGIIVIVLLAIFVVWLIGLAATGALIFWGVMRLSRPHA
jgi:lipopolysaccharide/colanic/teichoic acid biosynthesis glycosyltransferase